MDTAQTAPTGRAITALLIALTVALATVLAVIAVRHGTPAPPPVGAMGAHTYFWG